jgi:hypothetical protein
VSWILLDGRFPMSVMGFFPDTDQTLNVCPESEIKKRSEIKKETWGRMRFKGSKKETYKQSA